MASLDHNIVIYIFTFSLEIKVVLVGFVVTMHEETCQQKVLFARAWVHCSNKTRQIDFNQNYNMTFLILPCECRYSPLKRRIYYSMWEPLRVLLPLLHDVVPLNNGNCRLTTPVVKGRCARDAEPYTFNFGVFKSGKKNSITLKHITMNLQTWQS